MKNILEAGTKVSVGMYEGGSPNAIALLEAPSLLNIWRAAYLLALSAVEAASLLDCVVETAGVSLMLLVIVVVLEMMVVSSPVFSFFTFTLTFRRLAGGGDTSAETASSSMIEMPPLSSIAITPLPSEG